MENFIENRQHRKEIQKAQRVFGPKNFGFDPHGLGWKKKIDGIGEVVIAPISWEHAQFPNQPLGPNEEGGVFEVVSKLQQEIWAMPAADAVPGNVLSIINNTGGSILVAYELQKGCTKDGALGFSLAFGGRSGRLVSHMLGIREKNRSTADLGWYLKLIQAHEALKAGHTAIEWTYDPMRGANARLNIEKLGGQIDDFTIDKYGKVSSDLYGNVPTDRFTVVWDLLSPRVHRRVNDVFLGKEKGLTLSQTDSLPKVTTENVRDVVQQRPDEISFEIPGNIDELKDKREKEALTWRRDMRRVFGTLLNTHEASVPQGHIDPALSTVRKTNGDYVVDGFATGIESGQRRSFYRLRRKRGR